MTHWNYRVLAEKQDDEFVFQIIEVMYNDDGTIFGWTEADSPMSEDLSELPDEIERYRAALDKPVLIADESQILSKYEVPSVLRVFDDRDRFSCRSCSWEGERREISHPDDMTIGCPDCGSNNLAGAGRHEGCEYTNCHGTAVRTVRGKRLCNEHANEYDLRWNPERR